MAEVHLVRRKTVDCISCGFTTSELAEKWIEQNVMPGFRNEWWVQKIDVRDSLEAR